jgi:hypothetical protein
VEVVQSFLYWSLRRLLELAVLRARSEREKEIEVRVPRTYEEVDFPDRGESTLRGDQLRRAPATGR